MPVRFAYFILAHHRPEQLRLLVETIADGRDLILLHVDLKSTLGLKSERNGTWPMARRLAREYPTVMLMRPRCTNWGGWSLSQVLLDAIDIALEQDPDWTHFINLSGQCLPIKPLDDIRSQIGASGDLAFVELRHFSSLPADDWHLQWRPMLELPHKAIKFPGPRRPPNDFELEHKGSQWCILPRSFCEWQREAAIARRIRRYLKGLLLSDELLMPTLVRNGPWRDRVAPHYGREIVWPGPKVMTMADWPSLQRSPAFYARKFDLQRDDALDSQFAARNTPLAAGGRSPSRPAGRGFERADGMRVALIDPSLFTLPYDAALAEGLTVQGHDVALHGRMMRADDGVAEGTPLVPSFYRVAGLAAIEAMPTPLRLGIKGLDHIVSMAVLNARLKRDRPDVIHFQWLPLPLVDRRFLAALRRIAPLILTVHDSNPFNGNPAARVQVSGLAASFPRFDRLILHTEQGRTRLIEQGVPVERIALLPHGLLGAGRTRDAGPDAMAGELAFLLFGKLKPYKGLDLLIEAFARLPDGLRAQARLRAVGKPYMDLEPLRARAQRLGVAERVSIEPRFVPDDEIPRLFGPGTIAAFPYREIEASGVLSLAITHARPVLAARLGAFAETIRDGIDGVLVPPGDVEALSDAMARLIGDRSFAAACASNVRALAGAIPDWGEIARRTTAVYRSAGAMN